MTVSKLFGAIALVAPVLGAGSALAAERVPVSIQIRLPGENGKVQVTKAIAHSEAKYHMPGVCGSVHVHSCYGIPVFDPSKKQVLLPSVESKDDSSFTLTGSYDPGFCEYDLSELELEFTVEGREKPFRASIAFSQIVDANRSQDQRLECAPNFDNSKFDCGSAPGGLLITHYINKDAGAPVNYRFDLSVR
jgi:hypothetical protein